MPLVNSAGDPNLDYLSEGIAEHVITRLSSTPRLRVIARDSAFRYRGDRVDPARVGHDLGVRAVLAGTIAQRDQVLSVSARLIDTRNGRQVWQDHYERGVTDLQQLQTELAQDIAGSLQLRLSDAEQARFAVPYHVECRGVSAVSERALFLEPAHPRRSAEEHRLLSTRDRARFAVRARLFRRPTRTAC